MEAKHSFAGKTALVTGAGSGMGRETALLFAKRGAQVLCADISDQSCAETVAIIEQMGGVAEAFVADLSEHDACEAMVERTVKRFGSLDHAFNNAGIRGSYPDPWEEESVRRVLAVNLEGVYWSMKHEVRWMQDHGGGTIVNTASVAGTSGNVGALDYTAAKHGVIGLTKAAAMQFGPKGIRINAVCPGVIETEMTRRGRESMSGAEDAIRRLAPITGVMGEAADISEAVLWLSSSASKYVFGVALPVDAGYSIN